MGCYSFLYHMSGNPTLCLIDWANIEIQNLRGYDRLYYIATQGEEERPKNLAELAERLDESKLFGYFDEPMKRALIELCEHLVPYTIHDVEGGPKLFYEVEMDGDIGVLTFLPGTNHVYVSAIPASYLPEEIKTETLEEIEKRADRELL
jgi:hypothetical protein